MNFELMNIDDIDEVANIEKDIFTDPWPKQFFIEDLNNDCSKYYLLKDGKNIVGYAGLWFMFENCDLVNIGISKEYQGHGYGEQLLKFVIKEAIKNNCEFMHLEVKTSNIRAYNLYKKLGFEETRIRKAYYEDGSDCIDMVKGLLGLNEKDISD